MSNKLTKDTIQRDGLGPDNVYDKLLRMAGQHAALRHAVQQLQRQHFQTLLCIAIAAGGEIRLSKEDYDAIKGKALFVGIDKLTGEFIFRADEPEPPVESVAAGVR